MKHLNLYNTYKDFITDDNNNYPCVSMIDNSNIIGYKEKNQYSFYNNKKINNLYITLGEIIDLYTSMKETINNIVEDVDNQICTYGRMGRYNDSTWSIAGGTINTDVKNLLDKNYSFFPNIEVIKLPNGDTLDAPHFWAVLNTLFKGTGDLGGWAGDLVQFAANLKADNTVIFPSGDFGYEDWCSDADAYNIYTLYSGDILNGMKEYFTSNLTNDYRKSKFKTSDDIMTRYTNSSNSSLLSVLAMKYGVSNTDISAAANKMQEYLDK